MIKIPEHEVLDIHFEKLLGITIESQPEFLL